MKNSDCEFPYDTFPIRLEEYDEKNKLVKKCFFQTKGHLQKHIERHQLTSYKASIKDVGR